jgi:hypothetical protein
MRGMNDNTNMSVQPVQLVFAMLMTLMIAQFKLTLQDIHLIARMIKYF